MHPGQRDCSSSTLTRLVVLHPRHLHPSSSASPPPILTVDDPVTQGLLWFFRPADRTLLPATARPNPLYQLQDVARRTNLATTDRRGDPSPSASRGLLPAIQDAELAHQALQVH
ncbi:hypothetical protein HYQ46_000319 [Verticillium longisporum]|nr:hypothetical protein HYQ46_000319 [Verticillium longisporum]